MMGIHTFIDDINDQARRIVKDMAYVPANELGLDSRAVHRLFVNEDCIVVSKDDDRTLQYYGGFEYVDKNYRIEMCDYVIYLADDDRVREHIETYIEHVQYSNYEKEKEVGINEL
jgi:hypothetical protein